MNNRNLSDRPIAFSHNNTYSEWWVGLVPASFRYLQLSLYHPQARLIHSHSSGASACYRVEIENYEPTKTIEQLVQNYMFGG